MKLTRRTFLGFLSSLVATPLVAKDMGDFDFLPPEVIESTPIIPEVFRPKPVAVTGAMRYNINTEQFEIYKENRWEVLVTMEEHQS